jgi:hypothetical protein
MGTVLKHTNQKRKEKKRKERNENLQDRGMIYGKKNWSV